MAQPRLKPERPRLLLFFAILTTVLTSIASSEPLTGTLPPLNLVLQYQAGAPLEFYNTGMCFSDSRAILLGMLQQPSVFDPTKLHTIVMLDVAVDGYKWPRHAVVYHEDGWIYDPSIDKTRPQPVTIKPIAVFDYFAQVITEGPRLLRVVQGTHYVQNDGLSYLAELYKVDDPNYSSTLMALPGGGMPLNIRQFLEMLKTKSRVK